jgi:hypothetical protein
MEHPVLGAAIALGGELAASGGAGHGALYQVHVGLLAGLEHAELGVHRGELGDQPVRVRFGTVLGNIPGGPAVSGRRAILGRGGVWSASTWRHCGYIVELVVETAPPAACWGVIKAAAPHGQPVVLWHGKIS